MALVAKDLDGLEQAQVLDILNTAGNLMTNLRRSSRKYVSIALRLQYEVTGHNWVEEAKTIEVSLHGASIECHIPIAKGETMMVERLDNSRRTKAKVKWHRRRADGTQMLGVELVDAKNFWGLGATAKSVAPSRKVDSPFVLHRKLGLPPAGTLVLRLRQSNQAIVQRVSV